MSKTKKESTARKSTKRESTAAKEPTRANRSAKAGVHDRAPESSEASEEKTAKELVQFDRRRKTDRRASGERREAVETVAVERRKLQRRVKVNRRRQIDPTTCERDYSEEEIEFMNALDEYKRSSGRMFPTCSEVLEVIRGLGYSKAALATAGEADPTPAEQTGAPAFTVIAPLLEPVGSVCEAAAQP